MPTIAPARRADLLALSSTALVLAGCAEEPAQVEPKTDAEAIQFWLDYGRENGAEAHQIAVLERALARGTVLRSDINEVMPEYLDCLDAAGLTYHLGEMEAVPGSGISIPDVSVVMPSDDEAAWDGLAALFNGCADKHESWIAAAYANQPTAVEAEARVWTSAAMRECLASRGYAVDADATAAQIREIWNSGIAANIDNEDFYVC